MMPLIGEGLSRIEGPLKVTGAARYSADLAVGQVVYAIAVQSTISKGRIRAINASSVRRAPGVLAVITHENAPKLANPKPNPLDVNWIAGLAGNAVPLQSDQISFNGQHIGVVVAQTLEQAQDAAGLFRADYISADGITSLDANLHHAEAIKAPIGGPAIINKGDANESLPTSSVRIDQHYTIATEHHHPMEPSATIANWEGDRLTLYDSTQFVFGVRETLRVIFSLPSENVRVITNFVGGGFGCKRGVWPHVTLAAIAARMVGRPVKLMLTREQMFTSTGYRSPNIQRVALASDQQGMLSAIIHDAVAQSSSDEEFVEPIGRHTATSYACPNIFIRHQVVHLNVGKPTTTRSPGNATGSFALETAIDELADRIGLDPIALRLRNYADAHPVSGLPWSSKSLKQCYSLGSERFGWDRRIARPGMVREGRFLVGTGMAGASYPMARLPASARVRILRDGGAVVETATHEIGQGAYTILAQVASNALGIAVEKVAVRIGDTTFPAAPASAAATTTASVGSAVLLACRALQAQLGSKAGGDPASPLFGQAAADIDTRDGALVLRADPTRRDSFRSILAREELDSLEASANGRAGIEATTRAMFSFGAQFCEVRVDPDLGEVRVSRMLGVFAAGRILNAKTARSQMIGGMVWGIGMALHETSSMDHRFGRFTTRNLADYLVPVHADVPAINALFVEEEDLHVNELGVKGIGELGLVGAAAAIGNAVFNATGKRLRNLPIRPENFLEST